MLTGFGFITAPFLPRDSWVREDSGRLSHTFWPALSNGVEVFYSSATEGLIAKFSLDFSKFKCGGCHVRHLSFRHIASLVLLSCGEAPAPKALISGLRLSDKALSTGWLNHQAFISHRSGGWKSKIKVLAGLVSSEVSLPSFANGFSHCALASLVCLC
jgi:hypothetical protein